MELPREPGPGLALSPPAYPSPTDPFAAATTSKVARAADPIRNWQRKTDGGARGLGPIGQLTKRMPYVVLSDAIILP